MDGAADGAAVSPDGNWAAAGNRGAQDVHVWNAPERVRALIDRIVESKAAQKQLDDAPLTFGELSRIKEEFVTGLSGIYHQRIDYPTTREDSETTPSPVSSATAGRG